MSAGTRRISKSEMDRERRLQKSEATAKAALELHKRQLDANGERYSYVIRQEQKRIFRTFQLKLFTSQLNYARMLGDFDRQREVRNQMKNVHVLQGDEEFELFRKLQAEAAQSQQQQQQEVGNSRRQSSAMSPAVARRISTAPAGGKIMSPQPGDATPMRRPSTAASRLNRRKPSIFGRSLLETLPDDTGRYRTDTAAVEEIDDLDFVDVDIDEGRRSKTSRQTPLGQSSGSPTQKSKVNIFQVESGPSKIDVYSTWLKGANYDKKVKDFCEIVIHGDPKLDAEVEAQIAALPPPPPPPTPPKPKFEQKPQPTIMTMAGLMASTAASVQPPTQESAQEVPVVVTPRIISPNFYISLLDNRDWYANVMEPTKNTKKNAFGMVIPTTKRGVAPTSTKIQVPIDEPAMYREMGNPNVRSLTWPKPNFVK